MKPRVGRHARHDGKARGARERRHVPRAAHEPSARWVIRRMSHVTHIDRTPRRHPCWRVTDVTDARALEGWRTWRTSARAVTANAAPRDAAARLRTRHRLLSASASRVIRCAWAATAGAGRQRALLVACACNATFARMRWLLCSGAAAARCRATRVVARGCCVGGGGGATLQRLVYPRNVGVRFVCAVSCLWFCRRITSIVMHAAHWPLI